MELPSKGRQLRYGGAIVTIRDADWAADGAVELFVLDDHGQPQRILLSPDQGVPARSEQQSRMECVTERWLLRSGALRGEPGG